MKKIMALLLSVIFMMSILGSCGADEEGNSIEIPVVKKPTYMIYYGEVTNEVVNNARQYDIAILHPRQGNLTRKQVEKIQSSGTKVLGYIAVGEDLRTAGMTAEEMLADERFVGDGTGPKVDVRAEGETSLAASDINGVTSPGGAGFASYYLDDNDKDGKPDFNPYFTCAYTNIGDPNWYDVLDKMQFDGDDNVPGIKEILTTDYGRGLGCDGLFLDTVDTCAPNGYTSDEDPGKTRFEWTAPGVKNFLKKIKQNYPDKLVCQNRGLFFFNHLLEHYQFSTRENVDYLFYESYMLDSSSAQLFNDGFFADNKFNQLPKLSVEANLSDGFTVLSLGYAEGPDEFGLKKALEGKGGEGLAILRGDIAETENYAGFSHYITNANLTMLNDFVMNNRIAEDEDEPMWSSVYNNSTEWPPHEPEPRVGIYAAVPTKGGAVVYWDVALDKSGVAYVLYYSEKPFDFAADPELKKANKILLEPSLTPEYVQGQYDAIPYQAEVSGLESGKDYYMVIRAVDKSEKHNTEKNTVYQMVSPN